MGIDDSAWSSEFTEKDLRPFITDDGMASSQQFCGKRYTCQGTDKTGFVWREDEKGEGVKGCSSHPLVASAYQLGCQKSIQQIGSTASKCLRSEPCLEDEQGELHCVTRDVTQMPTAIDGSWKCVSDSEYPTERTHEKTGYEQLGPGFTLMNLQKKAHENDVADGFSEKSAERATTKSSDPPQERFDTAPTPSAPPKEDTMPPPQPPSENTTSAAPSDGPERWLRCNWFERPVSQSCSVDRDCPLTDTSEFDLWFDTLVDELQIRKEGKPFSGNDFLERVENFAMKTSVSYPKTQELNVVQKISKVRSQLQEVFDRDGGFRDSVKEMMHRERVLIQAHKEAVKGECVAGGCSTSLPSKPRTVHFDGKRTLVFTADTEGSVSYTTDTGKVVPVVGAVLCGKTNQGDDACTDSSIPEIVQDQLRAGVDKKAETYRWISGGSSYLIPNAISAFGTIDSTETKEACARRLCSVNEDQCPAPYCKLEGSGKCIPVESSDSITLKP